MEDVAVADRCEGQSGGRVGETDTDAAAEGRAADGEGTAAGVGDQAVSLDGLLAVDVRVMSGEERSAHLVALERAQAALDAHRLDAVGVWDGEAQWAADGARSGGGWLAPRCGLTRAAAGHRVKVARFVRQAPRVHDSLTAGRLTFPKVALFASAVRTEAQWARFEVDEGWLVAEVEGLTVEDAARFLSRWAWRADPDAGDADEQRRLRDRRVQLSETLDGVGYLSGALTAEAMLVVGQVLAGIIGEMRRADASLEDAERRSPAQLAHDALVEMARRAAGWKAEEMPAAAPSVTIVLTWAALLAEAGHATTTFGPDVSAATARRLACDAEISRLLTGPRGEPLDLGRSARLFSRAQRRALFARFGGCARPGCDRPPHECDVHHAKEWVRDRGETNVNDGVPLCRTGGCHDNVHRGTWNVTTDEAGTPTFTHADGRPLPDPRRAMLDATTLS